MRIVIDIGHPGHVHFFKNFIWEMEKRGHEIKIIARDKDVTVKLLDAYGFHYSLIRVKSSSVLMKILNIPLLDFKVFNLVKSFNPDVFLGIASWRASHVAWLLGKKSIIFDDTEHAKGQILLYRFLATRICISDSFNGNFGKRQTRYNGYHELAYLHPNRFQPNPKVLEEIGLSQDEPFFIIRFVSWEASHDWGQHGIQDKILLVKKIAQYGRVILTSEKPVPPELEPYVLRIAPEKLHDLLYYASLTIGEGATTASESAVLGTHAIYINTQRLGYLDEQESRYNLVYSFSDRISMNNSSAKKIIELLKDPDIRFKGKEKRKKLLKDKIDVTEFMVNIAETINLSPEQ